MNQLGLLLARSTPTPPIPTAAARTSLARHRLFSLLAPQSTSYAGSRRDDYAPRLRPGSRPTMQHRIHSSATILLRSTPALPASALRKAAAREKARVRLERSAERSSRRRQKEGLPRSPRPSAVPQFEGPGGERLTLSEQEKVLRRELADLSKELEKLEKKQEADEATKELPPLDDQTLDELYQALMMPPPASAEDKRLARLDSGRREKALLSSGVRTIADEKRMAVIEAQQLLRQRVIEARNQTRSLLPIKRPSDQPTVPEEPEDDGMVDLSQFSYKDRQEARLQLLFSRLTLLQQHEGQGQETDVTVGKQQSLGDIKSGLAARIAKILQDHNYRPSKAEASQGAESEGGASDLKEKPADDPDVPAFDSVQLDRSMTSQEAEAAASEDTMTVRDPQYIEAANEILADVSSSTARQLMLDRLESMLPQPLSRATGQSASTDDATEKPGPSLPLGIATIHEWTALAVACARADDSEALARTLKLMRRAGHFPPPLSLVNQVMDAYAAKGDVVKCQETMSLMSRLGLDPDSHTFHCLTKAYVVGGQYAQAIKVLNSLEDAPDGLAPASIATYTMVIDKLVDDPRQEIQALAWNLFYHMRLVAHPIPDAPLYALMIRACANGTRQPQEIDEDEYGLAAPAGILARKAADTERALDLFREMTTRYVVRPNAEVYNRLILACARRKDYYLEAFRLLRQMVELERERVKMLSRQDREGMAQLEPSYLRFAPDRFTFNALLEGCARNRDLPRARWVLAEMIRSTSPLFEDGGRGLRGLTRAQRMEMMAQRPNTHTLCHVFFSYASFEPPMKRGRLQARKQSSSTGDGANADEAPTSEATEDRQAGKAASNETGQGRAGTTAATAASAHAAVATRPAQQESEALTASEAAQVFSSLVPQTSSDVVTEARALMARIVADQPRELPNGGRVEGSLGSVRTTPKLLNAYLSVLAAHLPPTARVSTLWRNIDPSSSGAEGESREPSLFTRFGLTPSASTLQLVLDAASRVKPTSIESDNGDHTSAQGEEDTHEIATRVWTLFRDQVESEEATNGQWRTIEKIWAARIRFLAKHHRLEEAVATLREFAAAYPPAGPRVDSSTTTTSKAGAGTNSPGSVARKDTSSEKLARELDLSPMPVAQRTLETLAEPRSSVGLRPSSSTRSDSTAAAIREEDPAAATPSTPTSKAAAVDTVRPYLTFFDLELLHHRLVQVGHREGLAFLGWVARAYEFSGRKKVPKEPKHEMA